MNQGSRVYRRTEGVVHRVIGDEQVLIPIRQNLGDLQNLFALNRTAAFVFDQIDGCRDAGTICALLAGRCAVEPARIEGEVFDCLEDLAELGLIRPDAASAPSEGD